MGSNGTEYVLTPLSNMANLNPSSAMEFSLSTSGQLQATTVSVPASFPVATAHGVVFPVPGQNGSLQSYAVEADGSLQPEGSPTSYSVNQFSTLVSDSTYIYAVSDDGIFGFQDSSSGLSPLASNPQPQTVPSPCTEAQENLNQCRWTAQMTLGSGNAFLLQTGSNPGSGNGDTFQASSFTRTQGQLTNEQAIPEIMTYTPFASTPNGNFVYYVEGVTGNLVVYNNTTGNPTANVLSTGGSIAAFFSQLSVSADGSLLFAPLNASEPGSPSQIRVFSINSSSGLLTEVSGSPFSTGEDNFVAMTLDPSRGFLLAVQAPCTIQDPPCTTPGKLVAMSINTSTGALAVTSDVQDGVYPTGVTAAVISQ